MRFEIKNIPVSSLILSCMPAVLFVSGIIGGVTTFVLRPDPMTNPMTPALKFLSVGLFSLFYMFLFLALLSILIFVYNLLTGTLGIRGVRIDMEEVGEE